MLADGDRIARVGPADQLAAEPGIDRTLDTRECLVVPGLVNTHQHHWYLLAKGLGDGLILERWIRELLFPLGRALEDYGAPIVVMWCPSCNVHFTDAIYGRDATETAFDTTHTPAFLLDLLEQGRIRWRREVPLRVALHSHVGRTDHPTGIDRAATDRDTVSALLRALPGVELVATVASPPEFSFDCGPVATGMGPERFAAARQPMVEEARALGVDALVTISHACQREWCDVADADMDVVNYISLLAAALGLPPREDTLKRYKAGLAPEDIVAAGRGAWASHGLDEAQALELASSYFGEGKQP